MLASELYTQLTTKKYVYNIMPLENIPSVLEHGIVCYDQMQQITHSSIAMDEVQERRSKVTVPNGASLHQYANLYFTYHNPMLYTRQNIADELCVLAVSAKVMDIEGCILTDRNAAAGLVRFYIPSEGLEKLDFNKIYAQYWTDEDPFIHREKKSIKCAEILIPNNVPPKYIVGAYVVSKKAEETLRNHGFTKQIVVNPSVFYRR